MSTPSPCIRNGGFLDRKSHAGEQRFFENVYNEFVNLFGMEVSYFHHGYQLSAHNMLYGEHVTAPFSDPVKMKMVGIINEDAVLLSKFGIMTQADGVFIVGIQAFTNYMSSAYIEPKVGSLIRLDFMDGRPGGGGFPNRDAALSAVEFCTNPDEYQEAVNDWLIGSDVQSWIRSAPIYEITLKRDYLPTKNLNPMGTYTVWYIECIRWDYSAEPKAPREAGSNQVTDFTIYGKLSGGTVTAEPSAVYPQNVIEKSQEIWDYDGNSTPSSVYGSY